MQCANSRYARPIRYRSYIPERSRWSRQSWREPRSFPGPNTHSSGNGVPIIALVPCAAVRGGEACRIGRRNPLGRRTAVRKGPSEGIIDICRRPINAGSSHLEPRKGDGARLEFHHSISFAVGSRIPVARAGIAPIDGQKGYMRERHFPPAKPRGFAGIIATRGK